MIISELKSTNDEVKNFEHTSVWDDMQTLLMEQIDLYHESLERESDIEEIRKAQGGLAILRKMLALPQLLKEAVKEQELNNAKQ